MTPPTPPTPPTTHTPTTDRDPLEARLDALAEHERRVPNGFDRRLLDSVLGADAERPAHRHRRLMPTSVWAPLATAAALTMGIFLIRPSEPVSTPLVPLASDDAWVLAEVMDELDTVFEDVELTGAIGDITPETDLPSTDDLIDLLASDEDGGVL